MMRFFLLLAFTLLLCGCISVEQTLRLTEGNSLVVGHVYVYETEAEPALAEELARCLLREEAEER